VRRATKKQWYNSYHGTRLIHAAWIWVKITQDAQLPQRDDATRHIIVARPGPMGDVERFSPSARPMSALLVAGCGQSMQTVAANIFHWDTENAKERYRYIFTQER